MNLQNDNDTAEPTSEPGKPASAFTSATWKLKLTAVLLSVSILLALFWWVGGQIIINGASLNSILLVKAHTAYSTWFGSGPEIGIYMPDPVKGWRHIPSSSGKHYVPGSFDVQYHVDENGNRVTKASYDLPKILFVGCSITFGYGVADDSTFVSLTQAQMPGYKTLNTGVSGYGSGQAYLEVLNNLAKYDDLKMVVYPFINHHKKRNYLRKEWLDFLNRSQHLHFELENGQLVNKGLADPFKDAVADTAILNKKEPELTHAFLKAIADTCRSRNIPFLLVHLPDDESSGMTEHAGQVAPPHCYLDLASTLDLNTMRHPLDSHPNAKGHRLIAEQLFPFLQKHIPPPSVQ